MLYDCRSSADEADDSVQVNFSCLLRNIVKVNVETVSSSFPDNEQNEVDAESGDEQRVEQPRTLQSIASSAFDGIDECCKAIRELRLSPLPASLNAKQETLLLKQVSHASAIKASFQTNAFHSSIATFVRNLQKTVDADGYGDERTERTMATQSRAKPTKRPRASANENPLIPYKKVGFLLGIAQLVLCVQRETKRRPELDEERQLLIEASKEVDENVLRVDEGTACVVCNGPITTAIDLHECAVCEESMHNKCKGIHLEDCVDVQVSFNKKR
jgi:hypothetical protein